MAGPQNIDATTNGGPARRTSNITKAYVNRGDGHLFYQIFLRAWDDSYLNAHFRN